MIQVWGLQPDDMPDLVQMLERHADARTSFILSVRMYLLPARCDGGAQTDLIYTAGLLLSAYKVWEFIPAHELGRALISVEPTVLLAFMSQVDEEYLAGVLAVLPTVYADEAKASRGISESMVERAKRALVKAGLAKVIDENPMPLEERIRSFGGSLTLEESENGSSRGARPLSR